MSRLVYESDVLKRLRDIEKRGWQPKLLSHTMDTVSDAIVEIERLRALSPNTPADDSTEGKGIDTPLQSKGAE